MDPKDSNALDSWEQSDCGSGDPDSVSSATKAFSGLNVNAIPFIPGQNVYASEFVPSGLKQNVTESNNSLSEEAMDTTTEPTSDPAAAAAATPSEDPPDDWEGGDNSERVNGAPDAVIEDDDEAGIADPQSKQTDKAQAKPKKKPEKKALNVKKKDHLNIVFVGHVDAGKSTIGGHLLYLTGMVDKRTLEKYEKEAKEKNRETWYLSWPLDTNQEERDKGKTVEVGRAYFETDNKHFTILDAPGHKSFVPNMIGGASQADVAVLVISARRGEFETGFERGGQTREHAMLVKTAGVRKLVVVVNKMDDPTVKWSEGRYSDIIEKLTPYLKKCGFNPKTDIYFLPVSGLTGENLRFQTDESTCPFYRGPSLIEYLDGIPNIVRETSGPIRLPVVNRFKDMGTLVIGKVESGTITKGQSLVMMPNRLTVEVMSLWSDEDEVDQVVSGENVKCKLKNVEEDEVSPGFVLCTPNDTCTIGKVFDAQIVILEHKSIICAGYSAVMHIHAAAEEVSIKALICLVDKKGEKSRNRPRFIKQDQIAIVRIEVTGGSICLEKFKDFPQMGRFTLRDEGRTIGIGKVLKICS